MTAATRRNVQLLAAVHWAAGVTLILIDYYSRGMRIRPDTIAWTAYSCLLWMAMLPLTLRVTRGWDDRITAGRIATLFLSVLAAAALAEVGYFASVNVALRAVSQSPIDVFRSTLMSITYPTMTLLSATMIATVIRSASAAHERSMTIVRDEQKFAEARLSVLQSQLHPHFLFNSLNSLAALLQHDPAAAKSMLQRLEAFYLASSSAGDRPSLTLGEELGQVRQYVEIERVRFGERLQLHIDVDAASKALHVPALILQPIVENAVRHGIGRVPGPGFVSIRTASREGRVVVSVANNRDPTTTPAKEGIGLQNTRERLALAFHGEAEMRLAFIGAQALVEITLPAGQGKA